MTDSTCILTTEGWLYLCVVVDLYNKAVTGWAMRSRQTGDLAIKAVLVALFQHESCDAPVVLHSDRGTQFTCDEYQRLLRDRDLICSMSAVGHCGHNAPAKGFFGMLNGERVNRRRYALFRNSEPEVQPDTMAQPGQGADSHVVDVACIRI